MELRQINPLNLEALTTKNSSEQKKYDLRHLILLVKQLSYSIQYTKVLIGTEFIHCSTIII